MCKVCRHIDITERIVWLKYDEKNMYLACTEFSRFLTFLLENGLSFFYSNPANDVDPYYSTLASLWDNKVYLFPLFRGACQQLLALGYGRRELHSSDLPIFDEHLSNTRKRTSQMPTDPENDHCKFYPVYRELCVLIESFDSGPLSLQQLSRIAIRRAVGGANFATRMKRMSRLLPPILFEYVAHATELMLTSKQLDKLLKKKSGLRRIQVTI